MIPSFVCAVPARHVDNEPRIFRTWEASKFQGYNCTIWEAARATSAAPRFFKRILIGDPGMEEEFVDAGLGCNNPTKQLIQEASQELSSDALVGCIVSIGTGQPKVSGFAKPSAFQRILPLELIEVLKGIATDTEKVARDMEDRFRMCPGLYHRLNVDRGLDEISLEEWQRLGEVRTHTERYIRQSHVDRSIDAIVNALVGKAAMVPLGNLGKS